MTNAVRKRSKAHGILALLVVAAVIALSVVVKYLMFDEYEKLAGGGMSDVAYEMEAPSGEGEAMLFLKDFRLDPGI